MNWADLEAGDLVEGNYSHASWIVLWNDGAQITLLNVDSSKLAFTKANRGPLSEGYTVTRGR